MAMDRSGAVSTTRDRRGERGRVVNRRLTAPFLLEDALARHFLELLRMEATVEADVLRCEQLV